MKFLTSENVLTLAICFCLFLLLSERPNRVPQPVSQPASITLPASIQHDQIVPMISTVASESPIIGESEVALAPAVVCENGVCRIVQRPVPDGISTPGVRSSYHAYRSRERILVFGGRLQYLGRAVCGNAYCVGRGVLQRLFRR